ncbi:hypothetical protein [Devosia sp. RR2S18]|uniref:hypothetical protein n=1 Tax=Devosia rhizosphaerae TaxID=3049774 RepID=UPI002541CCAC|nr:hypothetical protein [Devosia sp. RR2S18]WIJ24866.1 hypothetical protein QOV41_17940 [Devosia sp. RR2S18]
MKLWAALASAARGWLLILRGEEGWRAYFSLTAAGLTTALAIFAFAAFLAVGFASMSIGMPSLPGVIMAMLVLAIPIAALFFALQLTRSMLKRDEPLLPVLVPGVYALTAFLLVEGFLAMFGPVVMLSWLALGYFLFRLTRLARGWSVGVAAAFAVLTVVLLVAMRLGLYMLSSALPAPS